jgi:hypothetical protein
LQLASLKENSVLKFIRRVFANLVQSSEPKDAGNAPFARTASYMSAVEDDLDRHFKAKIERRNQHIPELRPDQFNHDLAAIHRGRPHNPRRPENNNAMLQ